MRNIAEIGPITAKEFIMYMVEGLRSPRVKIDMDTFGRVWQSPQGPVYFGCAGTAAVLHMLDWQASDLITEDQRVLIENEELFDLLNAYERIRRGLIGTHNDRITETPNALLPYIRLPEMTLYPRLEIGYTEEQLQKYVELANYQEQ